MKTLDLNAYGVQEMNAVEMQKTDGGFIPIIIIVGIGLLASGCVTQRYIVDPNPDFPTDSIN